MVAVYFDAQLKVAAGMPGNEDFLGVWPSTAAEWALLVKST
jgi:hypothetical protein